MGLTDYLPTRWWERILHKQTTNLLEGRLEFRANTVVTSIPYNIGLDLDRLED